MLSRALARRWWRGELFITDASDQVPEHLGVGASGALPVLPAPDNDVCAASLRRREGLRRCADSIALVSQRARNRPDTAVSHPCHLGFVLIARALDGRTGSAVLCGLRHSPLSGDELEAIRGRLLELNKDDDELVLRPVAAQDADALARASDFVHLAAEVARAQNEQMQTKATRVARPSRRANDASVPFIGRSLAMLEVQRLIERVATSDTTVLVQGESGTGKELVARQIHARGTRREGPFVAQNCSALNENLLESALFGHVRGAFTGASRDTRGLFELADGGTLFLDEIGDMSASLQAKLLRVLQEGTFTPVGGSEERHSDVRIIAATHKDLAAEVRRGAFREDLYYRVNVIRLELPALRDREDDVLVLASHFLRAHSPPGESVSLDDEVADLFLRHTWPGNVRELQNEIERMVVLGGGRRVLGVDLVSPRIVAGSRQQPGGQAFDSSAALPKLAAAVEELERTLIAESLRRCRGNRSQVARELGMARSNLILKLQRYRLG